MSDTIQKCSNTQSLPLVLACSGAADTGEISDRAARTITRSGEAKMYCLAAVAAQLETALDVTKQAPGLLAIDGCSSDCAKKTLESAGFTNVKHVRVTDLGFEKGQSPATEESVRRVTNVARALLSR